MTENSALPVRQESAWRLLVELTPSRAPAHELQAVEQVFEAVHRLGLQPAQAARIQEIVLEALRVARNREDQVQHDLPVTFRVWISGAHTGDPDSPRKCRGWGAFLIQSQGNDTQALALEAHHAIELYLYQERALGGYQKCMGKLLQMTEVQEIGASPGCDRDGGCQRASSER